MGIKIKPLNQAQNSLEDLLKATREQSKERIPQEFLEQMQQATKDLSKFSFKDNTLQVGDLFPDEILLDSKGEEVSLKELLNEKAVIINFYRGTWCPYCNLELSYYNELLGLEENKGVRMVAISPEKPDLTIEVEDLNFTVSSDIDNKLAKKLNLVFKLPQSIQDIYSKFGIDLDGTQGNTNKELPVPAVFILDKDGRVAYLELDEDYTVRPDAKKIVEEFKKII